MGVGLRVWSSRFRFYWVAVKELDSKYHEVDI